MRDEVKTQKEAWKAYDQLSSDARVSFFSETNPERVEAVLRALTASSRFAHQQWPDAYLAAFAKASGLTLVSSIKRWENWREKSACCWPKPPKFSARGVPRACFSAFAVFLVRSVPNRRLPQRATGLPLAPPFGQRVDTNE